MQLKLRGLHVQVVVPARNDGGNRQAAVGGELGHLALPCPCQHIADLADAVLHGVIDDIKFHACHLGGNLHGRAGSRTEDAGTAQQPAKPDHGRHRLLVRDDQAGLALALDTEHQPENLLHAGIQVARIGDPLDGFT